MTPLHYAAQTGNIQGTGWLLAAGADPTSRTQEGATPADVARENGHQDLLELFQ
jgi:ankyrin repeat protein